MLSFLTSSSLTETTLFRRCHTLCSLETCRYGLQFMLSHISATTLPFTLSDMLCATLSQMLSPTLSHPLIAALACMYCFILQFMLSHTSATALVAILSHTLCATLSRMLSSMLSQMLSSTLSQMLSPTPGRTDARAKANGESNQRIAGGLSPAT